MEIAKNIYEALAKMQDIQELRNFLNIVDIKGVQKPSKLNLYNYVSKGELRPVRTGVFYDKEAQKAIATDGHLLVASSKHYKDEFADKIILKDGLEFNEGKYPNWRNVIPNWDSYVDLFELDPTIEKLFLQYKAKFKATKDISAYIIHSFNGVEIAFGYKLFKLFIKAVKELDANKIYYKSDQNAICAKAENGDCVLLMPYYKEDRISVNTDDVTEPFLIYTDMRK